MLTHVLSVAVPAGLFSWWALTKRPLDIGWASVPAVAALVPLLIVLAFIARRRAPRVGRERAAAGILFVTGAAVTCGFWFRVWNEPGWDIGGIVVGGANAVGFWWPAVLVAAGMWTLEELIAAPGGWPRFRARVLVGFVAGAAGVTLYVVGAPLYYERWDRTPLASAVTALGHELGGVVPVGVGLPYRLDGRHLQLDLEAGPALNAPPYLALTQLERAFGRIRQLVARKDVERVTVVLRTRGEEVVRFAGEERDSARPVLDLVRLDRSRLASGGRLDDGSLHAMLDGVTPDHRARFLESFRYAVAGDEVRLTFRPATPAGADAAELQGAAWASANNIVREVTRYFPDVARFRVTLPRLATVVTRAEVAADFRLQHRLVPGDRVLGLSVSDDEAAPQPLEPATFYPQPPVPGFQVALVHHAGPLTQHAAGLLFERVASLGLVIDVDADGAVTVLLDGRDGRSAPVRLAPGDTVTLRGRTLHSAGWLSRSTFRSP